MKKLKFSVIIALVAVLTLTLGLSLSACNKNGNTDSDPYTITVGASKTPHSEILEVIKDELADIGFKLDIKIFDDYIIPNTALDNGELDANFFQHTPYLLNFNKEYNTDLVSVAKIHYEPFGLYGNGISKADYTAQGFAKTGRTILIPNDGTNLARALFLLQQEGFITLNDGVTPDNESLTVYDIKDAKGNNVTPVAAENVAAQLSGASAGTLAVINGNYALQAGLSVKTDAIAIENAEGDAAQLYANVLAVKRGNENHPKIKALLHVLLSQKVIDFINDTYNGAVVPVFEA